MYTSRRHHQHGVDRFNDVVQVETIDGTEDNSGYILMTDLFTGLTIAMVMGLVYLTSMYTPVQAKSWILKKVGNYVKSWS